MSTHLDPEQAHFLLDHHREMLRASAIAEPVALARGYRSITKKVDLERLRFRIWQRQVPTLLIKVWSPDGSIGLLHHRPDDPRLDPKTGKVVKYEFRKGERMCLDVHPHIREQVRDPTIPLYITEGIKKVDSAISHGLCCIGLLGVWNWRGTNEHGGKMVLPEWDEIPLNGRIVYIVFDADFAFNSNVFTALKRLHAFLKKREAHVRIVDLNRVQLPGRPSGK